MHICLVSREYPPETAWGGIGTYTQRLAQGLSNKGHRVQVITLSTEENEYVRSDGSVVVHRIRPKLWRPHVSRLPASAALERLAYSLRVDQKLRQLSAHERFDLVEFPVFFAEGFIYHLHPLTPTVVRMQTSLLDIKRTNDEKLSVTSRILCWMESWAARRATRVLANSHYSAQGAQQDHGIAEAKLRIVPLGMDIPSDPNADAWRSEEGERTLTVLAVGRLSQRKGTHLLLQAIPSVVQAFPNTRFIMVGKDRPMSTGGMTYREYFARLAGSDLPETTVEWRDFVSDAELKDLYHRCDIVAAPSLYESFGLVHLEGMSYGKAVVACRSSATPEIVLDGETGVLVDAARPQELAEAIIKLFSNQELRLRMGAAGRQRAHLFSTERMVELTVAAYHEACNTWRAQSNEPKHSLTHHR